jgi:hypothetical protein
MCDVFTIAYAANTAFNISPSQSNYKEDFPFAHLPLPLSDDPLFDALLHMIPFTHAFIPHLDS